MKPITAKTICIATHRRASARHPVPRHVARPVNQLHAATDLAGLWIERSERQKAHDLLAPILDWFTGGFDTPDLIDAKACLKATAT